MQWVEASGLPVVEALDALNTTHAAGQLNAHLAWALENCHDKRRAGQRLNKKTYYNWLKRIAERGHAAPRKIREDLSMPAWGPLLLKHFRRPQKPALTQATAAALAEWNSLGHVPFSYDQAYRLVKKINAHAPEILYRGRNQGAGLKALLPYIRRGTEHLWANDVWTGDGHGFKAKIAHPDHGRPFTPETTLIMDVASRKIMGWSVSYSENVIAVCDALRHAVSRHGLPLIYYSDNGPGQTAKQLDAPLTGMLGRLGIHHETGIPNSPQGRGIIERTWQTLMIPLARAFPTFSGSGADRDFLRRTTLEIEKDLRAGKTSPKLPSVEQFKQALNAAILWYNGEHVHSAVKTTPDAAYAERAREQDVVMLDEAELIDLFRPHEERTAERGMVRLWNNIYFSQELMRVNGQKVLVGYDIHNPAFVVVRRINGEFICRADWNANERDYFPTSLTVRKHMERVDRKVKRGERIIEEAEAELGNTYDALPSIEATTLPPLDITPAREPAHLIQQPVTEPRPNLAQMGDYSLLTWLADHPEDWNDGFRNYFASQARNGSRTISNALDEYGLWSELEKRDFKVAG